MMNMGIMESMDEAMAMQFDGFTSFFIEKNGGFP
jgi:hypothetical protein